MKNKVRDCHLFFHLLLLDTMRKRENPTQIEEIREMETYPKKDPYGTNLLFLFIGNNGLSRWVIF